MKLYLLSVAPHALVAWLTLSVTACHPARRTPAAPTTTLAGTSSSAAVPVAPQVDPWSATAAGTPGTGLPPAIDGQAPVEAREIDSVAILQRTAVADEVQVKHVLLAWQQLAEVYEGAMDPRAQARSNPEAAALAQSIAAKLAVNPADIDRLVAEYSEDPATASEPLEVSTTTAFLPAFKQLALRLQLNEVGIVRTEVGYHVVLRVSPAPADPLESTSILARPAVPGVVFVQHVLIGWRDVPASKHVALDERAQARDKNVADKLAASIFAKLRSGSKMTALMKQFSEDPGSADNGKVFEVDAQTPFVAPFKKLALRLKVGEAGIVRSPFGWHIIKRIAAPLPDALESRAILQRQPVTAMAKVKHILLSYDQTGRSSQDPRGAARSRAQLDTLVKKTVAALKAKAPIEPLMAELSEDPGSAQSGISYDVTPEAGLVAPFKALGLRLKVFEVGVVKTEYGFHILQRVE